MLVLHGIKLTLTPAGKLRPVAEAAPPAEVLAAIRQHREALVARLTAPRNPEPLPRLPEPLRLLVQAAAADQLNGGAVLASGMVPSLGGYVTAWALAYLTGAHSSALPRLWEAHAAWQGAAK